MHNPEHRRMRSLEEAVEAFLGGGRQPADAESRELWEMLGAGDRLAEPEAEGRRFAGYRIVREVGAGGMGVVYEAEDIGLQRTVALKVLPAGLGLRPESIARFRREALAVARLQHPGIVKVHGEGAEDGVPFLAMEFVAGAPLDRVIAALGAASGPAGAAALAMAVDELAHHPTRAAAATSAGEHPFWRRSRVQVVADLVLQVADALEHAHQRSILHRDVKPSNILVRPDGTAVLTDFGLARDLDLPGLSQTGDLAGTPYYLSPEQIAGGARQADARSDVWALGATLYELLTLRRAFAGDSTQQVLVAIATRDPVDPRRLVPALPRDLAAIAMQALDKDPARRYPSAAAFADDLRALLAGRPVSVRPLTLWARTARWSKREPRIAGSLAFALVALAGGLTASLLLLASNRRALSEFRGLSDLRLVQEQTEAASKLWPTHARAGEEAQAWLVGAAQVLSRTDQHRDTLRRLEAIDRASLPADGAAALAWQVDLQRQLVRQLGESFRALRAAVEARQAEFERVREASVGGEEARAAWRAAAQAIVASKHYGGLALAPQFGLLPLGEDLHSGLWEFWHVQSGARPQRDPGGKLQVTGETGIVLVLVPGGKSWIGADPAPPSPQVDPQATELEGPCHEVTLAPYFLGKHELTQGIWMRIAGGNPSSILGANTADRRFPKGRRIEASHPVESVSWGDATAILARLGLRLPTEAQWERACRAGTTTVFFAGDEVTALAGFANVCDRTAHEHTELREPGDLEIEDGWVTHAPVGSYRPNAFGLHDMVGNVAEWCHDEFMSYKVPPAAGDGLRTDARGEHPARVIRGGAFQFRAQFARCARRYAEQPMSAWMTVGLRPARRLEP
jgi:serine/threonine protein kinase/formylglycine-generating enzyme required for sulfatase activity